MKTIGTLLAAIALTVLPLHGQVVRHQNDHLHYTVTLIDGDISKITKVSVNLKTAAPEVPNQLGAIAQFGTQCEKTNDPKIWSCDITIPPNIRSGDFRLFYVGLGDNEFGKSYEEDFHLPLVPIQNTNTFTPPSKVTVQERP